MASDVTADPPVGRELEEQAGQGWLPAVLQAQRHALD